MDSNRHNILLVHLQNSVTSFIQSLLLWPIAAIFNRRSRNKIKYLLGAWKWSGTMQQGQTDWPSKRIANSTLQHTVDQLFYDCICPWNILLLTNYCVPLFGLQKVSTVCLSQAEARKLFYKIFKGLDIIKICYNSPSWWIIIIIRLFLISFNSDYCCTLSFYLRG